MKIEKFFKDHNIDLNNKKIVVATSAGPDSMALLDMLHQTKATLIAAHVDHLMRPDSYQEMEVLTNYCENKSIELVNYIWKQKLHPKTGLEAAARKMRYKFLTDLAKKIKADFIVTAHHNDDLLENILLKFMRSGYPEEMNSLHAINKINGVLVLRPLLMYDKKTLLNYDQDHKISYIIDDTNNQDITLRNILRHKVEPVLKTNSDNLADKVDNFTTQMDLLTQLSKKAFTNVKTASFLADSIRITKKDLLNFTLAERVYFYEQLIWDKWKRHVNLTNKTQTHGFLISETSKYIYLIKKANLFYQKQRSVQIDEPFTFGKKVFQIVDNPENKVDIIGKFKAAPNAEFTYGSIEPKTKIKLATGQHTKPKKLFAAKQVPNVLRPTCLTIYDQITKEPIFIEKTSQNQYIEPNQVTYGIMLVNKN